MKNLTDEEFAFICNKDNLRLWAALSIEKRCRLFHRRFNDRHISSRIMLKAMKLAGLRKKKVKVCNIPARKEDRAGEFAEDTLRLDN